MFLYPLIGGVIPFMAIYLSPKLNFPQKLSFNIYNAGTATLTVGSCFAGVLEIYGTTSSHTIIYFVLGALFVFIGLLIYIFQKK